MASTACLAGAGVPQTVCPFPEEATHPRCYGEGYPDEPGRASNKESEGIVPRDVEIHEAVVAG